jgi:hypothetical protein
MVSLVVPAIAVTIFLSSPNKALVKEDLPTFGRPTIAILGKSLPSIAPVSSGNVLIESVH